MFWHIDTDIVSLLVVAVIYICDRRLSPNMKDANLRERRFTRCLEVSMIVTLIDIAASIVMDFGAPRFVYHLFMTLYFSSIELLMVAWFRYVLTMLYTEQERAGVAIADAVTLVYALYSVFIFSNPWTGLVYSLGPNGKYERGPLFFLMVMLFVIYTIVLLILTLLRWRHIPERYPNFVLILTPIITGIGVAVQLLMPGWLLILPVYMVCLVLAFFFLQTMRVRNSVEQIELLSKSAETDPLTGLYNRAGMGVMVQKTLREACGEHVFVMLADIDDLKHINDTMGHAEGDRAIRLVAERLRRHFRSGDTVVRFGGDEFLAFFFGTFTQEQALISMQNLVAELNQLRIGAHDEESIRVSIGGAYGVVGTDTFEEMCDKADTALYHVKRNGKNSYALFSPDMDVIKRTDRPKQTADPAEKYAR